MFPQLNPIRNRRRRRRGEKRSGASAVEFAMVAPAFLIVIVVCAEFSRMSMMRNLAQNACYEASRYVITEGATIEDGIQRAQDILSRLGNVQATIRINNADGSSDSDGNVINQIEFDTESVQTFIEIKLADNAVLLPGSMFGDNKIQAQMTLRTERYRGYFNSTTTGN
ncbi:MAG: TadE/TadG family type IV pilus assembly protein [Planctomycetota bacterium]